MPPQAAECRSNKSPDVPLIFFSLFLRILFTCPAWKCSFVAERSLPACLWTACVPWACPRRRWLVCLSLYSWWAGCCLWADSSTEILGGNRAKKEYKGRYDAVSTISQMEWIVLGMNTRAGICTGRHTHCKAEKSSLWQVVEIRRWLYCPSFLPQSFFSAQT